MRPFRHLSPAANSLVLTAQIEALKALRYTPAGLPALDMELVHASEVQEAGQTRQVQLAVKAVAFGSLAESLAKQTIGSLWQFTGFLAAARSRSSTLHQAPSKQVVFHVQAFQPDPPNSA